MLLKREPSVHPRLKVDNFTLYLGVGEGAILFLDCSTLPLILPYNSVLSKEASSTILFVSLVWLNLGLIPGRLGNWWTLYPLEKVVFISIWYKNGRHEALWFYGEGEGSGHAITNCLRDHSLPLLPTHSTVQHIEIPPSPTTLHPPKYRIYSMRRPT